jgi:hypothetical protein
MNNLAIRNNNTSIEIPQDWVPVAGIEQLDPDDFSLPVMKLVQSNTQIDNAEELLGQWYRTDTGEAVEIPNLILIGIAKQRVLFASDFANSDKKALCRSDDSKSPRADLIGQELYVEPATERHNAIVDAANGKGNFTIGSICANCPLSQWVNSNKPPCKQSDNWAAVTSDGDPVIVRFGGSAAKMGAKLRNLARIATVKRKPLYIALGSHLEEGASGNYYVPDILAATADLSPELIDMAKQFASVNLAARYEDLGEEDQPAEQVKRKVIDLSQDMTGMPEIDELMPF